MLGATQHTELMQQVPVDQEREQKIPSQQPNAAQVFSQEHFHICMQQGTYNPGVECLLACLWTMACDA